MVRKHCLGRSADVPRRGTGSGRTRPKYQPIRPSEEPLRVKMAIVRMIERKMIIA